MLLNTGCDEHLTADCQQIWAASCFCVQGFNSWITIEPRLNFFRACKLESV